MKVIFTLVGILLAAAGVYFAYQQYVLARKTVETVNPEVVVCLKSFAYSRTQPRGIGTDLFYVPQVKTSFNMVNTGSTPVTVTKVMLNPTGEWKGGGEGGMNGFEVELNKPVPGNGVIVINEFTFSPNIVVADRFWIDKPKAVNVRAYWAGGVGRFLDCIQTTGGGWACGKESANTKWISVDSACQ